MEWGGRYRLHVQKRDKQKKKKRKKKTSIVWPTSKALVLGEWNTHNWEQYDVYHSEFVLARPCLRFTKTVIQKSSSLKGNNASVSLIPTQSKREWHQSPFKKPNDLSTSFPPCRLSFIASLQFVYQFECITVTSGSFPGGFTTSLEKPRSRSHWKPHPSPSVLVQFIRNSTIRQSSHQLQRPNFGLR